MGWNDHIDDSKIDNLPEEAFDNPYNLDGPFEPNNRWLPTTKRYLQEIAIREGFSRATAIRQWEHPTMGEKAATCLF
ncbi:MAG: hypothetical protein P8104_11320, partial [Gammaproteobacteria bacterium]